MVNATDDVLEYTSDAADDPPHLDDDDRGQLMLAVMLAIAVLLVSLALTLNTMTYTENLVTRTINTNPDGAVNHGGAVEAGAGMLLDEVNREDGTYGELTGSFDEALGNWSDTTATLATVRGAVTDAEHVSYARGTRVSQPNATRNFTDGNGTADWTLMSDVGVRGVRFNVSYNSPSTSSASSFHLVVDDETNAVETVVYRDSSRVSVAVEDTDGMEATCNVVAGAGDYVMIDAADGRLNETVCDPLDAVHTGLDGSVTVSYRNASEVEGSYELYVNGTNATVFDAMKYELAGSGSPPITWEALYTVIASYVYESDETYVSRGLRVALGEIV